MFRRLKATSKLHLLIYTDDHSFKAVMDENHLLSESTEASIFVAGSANGRGVFAKQPFNTDDLVGNVSGTAICDADYQTSYGIDLGEDYTLEPSAPFRYLNHSCEPNCVLLRTEEPPTAIGAVIVEAIRDIEPGDELTIDYAWPANGAIPCNCQSENCRGWVVAIEEVAALNPPVDAALPAVVEMKTVEAPPSDDIAAPSVKAPA